MFGCLRFFLVVCYVLWFCVAVSLGVWVLVIWWFGSLVFVCMVLVLALLFGISDACSGFIARFVCVCDVLCGLLLFSFYCGICLR